MLATLNSRQIVDEIVKDTVKDNDPHDAVQISPEMVLAARASSVLPSLASEIASRSVPKTSPEPKISGVSEAPMAMHTVDTAVRAAAGDLHSRQKRSSAAKWLRGAFVTMLFAGGSAAATVAWEKHGDTAKQMFAQWSPALTSLMPLTLIPSTLMPSTSQTTPVAAAQADDTPDQSATPPATQDAAPAPAVTQPAATQPAATQPDPTQPDPTQSVQAMTRDLAVMAQQIEQLKANIAELKAGQEQISHEMAKPPAPKPVAEVKPIDPRARVSALPPRQPVRKPKPVATQAYVLAPPAPPPPQAVAVPPPVATTQAVADDDGPVVRPPMPVH
ncbi:hypothetical protein ABIB73_006018 [Bradyrhizobium sp. F1.4.3]|uniref:hypothetical protein n=1 Tax=Bradyrhizobium sp. F1.4.3 TaxID=3156356 RepID=UPI0033927E13